MLRSLFINTKHSTRRVRQQPLSSTISSVSVRSGISDAADNDENALSNDARDNRTHNNAIHTNVGSVIGNNTVTVCRPCSAPNTWTMKPNQSILSSPHVWNPTSIQIQQPMIHSQGLRYMSSYNTRAFVSRHNNSINVTAESILEYCAKHNGNACIEGARTTNTHVVLRECPFCTKPTRNDPTNLYKLHIQIGGGAFFCHRCGTGGSWYDLKARFGGFNVERGIGGNLNTNANYRGGNSNQHFQSGAVGGKNHDGGWNYSNSRQPEQPGHNSMDNNNNKNSSNGTDACLPMPPTRLSGLYSTRLLDDAKPKEGTKTKTSDKKDEDSMNDPLRYLTKVRGLNTKTLRKYGVGRAAYKFPSDKQGGGYKEAECITFPWIMRESDVRTQEEMRGATFELEGNQKESSGPKNSDTTSSDVPTGPFVTRRIKARALERKSWQRLDPPGGGWGLFGLHTVPDDCTTLILTEGEYDAMAVHQATGLPAVSLPNGCRSLPLQVLPILERFEKIVLWMDSDEPGREGAEKFAKKLGVNRTYIVQCAEAKDANDALLQGTIDMKVCIDEAALLPHDRILTFGDLRKDVLKELLEPDLYSGTAIPSLPKFTSMIKGFRRGEMTVLTGPTGCGKTTFLGQVSLDLAEQGENVLWGSFEIKNTRLLHKLMKQFSRDSLPLSTDKNARENLEALADRFENLSLYFMKFHGGSDVDEVLDAMEYAVYVNDVEHIILDNMQFMITRHTQKSSWDKFEVQDIAIEKFRKFATEHNVHVTLVVHPRKEDESSALSISSFFGSAKATQEADTVIIIQNDANRRKYLDVKKNRFDGTLGYSPIYFQSKSGRYVEDEASAGSRTAQQGQQQQQNTQSSNENAKPKNPIDIDGHHQYYQSSSSPGRA